MAANLKDYLSYRYSTLVVPEQTSDGGVVYVATHPELEGCIARGGGPEEAQANLVNDGLVILRGAFGGRRVGSGNLRIEGDGYVKQPTIQYGVEYFEW